MTQDASGALAAPRHAATRTERRSDRHSSARDARRSQTHSVRHARALTADEAIETPMEDQRTAGMLAHGLAAVVTLLSVGALGFLVSLIVFLIYKDRGEFIRGVAANAVNIQIMTVFGLFFAIMLSVIGTFIAIIAAAIILAVAVAIHIMGALRASRGDWWTPPLTPRMVK